MIHLQTHIFFLSISGQVKPGQCGRCDGMQGVDTLGVYEFDTRSETFIANHLMPAGVGGDPFSSPDGRYIVLVGRNGGEKLRFLKTANNGQRSVSILVHSNINVRRFPNF